MVLDPVRFGTDWTTDTTDAKALFLKIYGGEVLAAFDERCIMKGRHKERTITSGKSAQFPATWKLSAEYHTIGSQLLGLDSETSERVIEIDDMLVSHVFVAKYDEAMSHFEMRSELTRQTGLALANAYDKNVMRVGLLAANATATIKDSSDSDAEISEGGSSINIHISGDDAPTGANLSAGLFTARQKLDEKDVVETPYAIFRPANYYLLVAETDNININWKGEGSYSKGKIAELAGIEILKSNHLPDTDESADTNVLEKYRGDHSTTQGLVMTPSAVGTVKLIGLQTESQYDITRQGTFIVSKMAVGHGILRPECAVELTYTDTD